MGFVDVRGSIKDGKVAHWGINFGSDTRFTPSPVVGPIGIETPCPRGDLCTDKLGLTVNLCCFGVEWGGRKGKEGKGSEKTTERFSMGR